MKKENTKNNQMDTQAMMDVYAKLAIPGPPHRLLASMGGVANKNKVLGGTRKTSRGIHGNK
jgi:hypothetical protein